MVGAASGFCSLVNRSEETTNKACRLLYSMVCLGLGLERTCLRPEKPGRERKRATRYNWWVWLTMLRSVRILTILDFKPSNSLPELVWAFGAVRSGRPRHREEQGVSSISLASNGCHVVTLNSNGRSDQSNEVYNTYSMTVTCSMAYTVPRPRGCALGLGNCISHTALLATLYLLLTPRGVL